MKILILSGDREMYPAAMAIEQSARDKLAETALLELSDFAGGEKNYQKLLNRTKKIISSVYRPYDPLDGALQNALREYIEKIGFDCVISADSKAIKAAVKLRKTVASKTKFYGVLTDSGAVQGFRGESLDGFFVAHEDLVSNLKKKGIKGEIYSSGVPVEKRFFNRFGKKAARNYLVIPEHERVYLLIADDVGFDQTRELCDEMLREEKEPFLFYVFVDRGSENGERLKERYRRYDSIRVITVNKKLSIYMECADVMLTKPEGYLSFEAAAAGVPLVHLMTVRGPAATAEFFSSHDMSLLGNTVSDAVRKARRLIDEQAVARRMMKRQSMLVGFDAADKILDRILSKHITIKES